MLVSLAPFFVAGWYLVSARPTDRTVIEMVIAVPLMVALAGAVGAVDRPASATRLGVLGGLAIAATAMFKLVLMPIAVVFVVLAAVVLWRRGDNAPARRLLVAGAVAALVPVVALVG